jgi:TolB protein
MKQSYLLIWIPALALACNLGATASTPAPDLLATLQASTPSINFSPAPSNSTPTVTFDSIPTITPIVISGSPTSVPSPSASDGLTGHIVFTCQVYKAQASDQICMMNADGTGWRQLTADAGRRHYYSSLAPDGASVVYSAFLESNYFEIYEMNLDTGIVGQLTRKLGVANGPEISPDGKSIVFTLGDPLSDKHNLWLMNRDGSDPHNIPKISGWDPTWSPDGKQILFASDKGGSIQLYVVKPNGKEDRRISNLSAIRGRSDWSPDGQFIVTYSGAPWHREVYLMNADGSNARQISPPGGNAQGPSFSPDGKWVAFTAYYDRYGDDHGCEIYVVRIDGTDLRRLTNNDYCDYQPRWGP